MNKLFRKTLDLADWLTHLKAYWDKDRQFVPVSFPRLAGQTVYDKRDGRFLNLAIRRKTSDWAIFEQIFLHEEYRLVGLKQEPALQATYRRIVASGSTPLILDCGANNGLSCAWLARTFPEALVLGVEPEPGNFALARHNTAALANARVLQAAVAARDSTLKLRDPGHGTSGFQTEAADDGADGIPAYAIPSLIALAGEGGRQVTPFLFKIDIEGFEGPLFAENTDWIDAVPLIIVELHDWLFPGGGTSSSFLRAMAPRRRDFLFRGENVFSIRCEESR